MGYFKNTLFATACSSGTVKPLNSESLRFIDQIELQLQHSGAESGLLSVKGYSNRI